MSAWITITTDDLNDYLVAAQVSALRSAAMGSGQTDPFPRVMHDVCTRIRTEIQACTGNLVSLTAYTIPPELKSYACHRIIEALQTRIPRLEFTDSQKKQCDEAREFLRRIAKCEIPVSQPDDPDSTPDIQAGNGVSVVTSTARTTGRNRLSGL